MKRLFKKIHLFLISFFLFYSTLTKAQPFELLYHPSFNSHPKVILNTPGGGFLLATNIRDSSGEFGILFTKFDHDFHIIVERTIDEPGVIEGVSAMVQDAAGNIYIAAEIGSQFTIIKTDSIFDLIWIHQFISMGHIGQALNIALSPGGNLYASGSITYFFSSQDTPNASIVMRLDTSGSIIWQRSYSYNHHSVWTRDLHAIDDDHLMLVYDRTTVSAGVLPYYIEELDSNGNTLHLNYYGFSNYIVNPHFYKADRIFFVVSLDYEKNYLIDYDRTSDTIYHYSRIELDTLRRISPVKIIPTADGGFAVAMNKSYNYIAESIGLYKLDSLLNVQWIRSYTFQDYIIPTDLTETASGFCIIGYSPGYFPDPNNVVIIRTDAEGHTFCNDSSYQFTQVGDTDSHVLSTIDNLNRTIQMQNITSAINTFNSTSTLDSVCTYFTPTDERAKNTLSVYPNPAGSILNVNFGESISKGALTINGPDGKCVFSKILSNSDDKTTLDVSTLSDGVYILTLNISDRRKMIRKFLVMK